MEAREQRLAQDRVDHALAVAALANREVDDARAAAAARRGRRTDGDSPRRRRRLTPTTRRPRDQVRLSDRLHSLSVGLAKFLRYRARELQIADPDDWVLVQHALPALCGAWTRQDLEAVVQDSLTKGTPRFELKEVALHLYVRAANAEAYRIRRYGRGEQERRPTERLERPQPAEALAAIGAAPRLRAVAKWFPRPTSANTSGTDRGAQVAGSFIGDARARDARGRLCNRRGGRQARRGERSRSRPRSESPPRRRRDGRHSRPGSR